MKSFDRRMIIRSMVAEDLERVLPLIEEFCKESLSEYGLSVDKEHIENIALELGKNTLLGEIDGKMVGMLTGVVVPIPSSGKKAFQEVMWFVSKPHRKQGLRLLRALEDRCREQGIDSIIMVAMANSKSEELDDIYKRNGFRFMEKHYIKNLGG